MQASRDRKSKKTESDLERRKSSRIRELATMSTQGSLNINHSMYIKQQFFLSKLNEKFRKNNLKDEMIVKNNLMKKKRSAGSWILSSFFRRLTRKYSKLLLIFYEPNGAIEGKKDYSENALFCLGSKKSQKMEYKKKLNK